MSDCCDDYTVEIKLPNHKAGKKWCGIASIGPVMMNGETPASQLVRVRMWMQHSSGKVVKFDTQDDVTDGVATPPDVLIVITDPANWVADVPDVGELLDVPGQWGWDMDFFDATGDAPMSLYKGVLKVINTITG